MKRYSSQTDTEPEIPLTKKMIDHTLDQIINSVHIDLRYDVPYLAGYSQDSKTIYLDKDMPDNLTLSNGKTIKVYRYLILHETVEKTLIDGLNMHYQQAHAIATHAERDAVEADGISWAEYDAFMQDYAKKMLEQQFINIPPDLDLRPYYDEHDWALVERMEEAMTTQMLQQKLSSVQRNLASA